MKKIISLILSVVMMISVVSGFPFSAQAATASSTYDNAVISANIGKIKSYILNNYGKVRNVVIDDNGDYTFRYDDKQTDIKFTNLFVVNHITNELTFETQQWDKNKKNIQGIVSMKVDTTADKKVFTQVDYWLVPTSEGLSDFCAHTSLDRNFNYKKQYAAFKVDYNGVNFTADQSKELCNGLLSVGMIYWDYMLDAILGMDMGCVGFGACCYGHKNSKVSVKATATKDGYTGNRCSKCGLISSLNIIACPKNITLSASAYTYDGKVKRPTVTVKDSNGKKVAATNYTVTYASGRKNVGKYAVKVTFKGNYSGSKIVYFNINPKGTTISSVTAKSKGFTVKWKKQATQTTGYQIQYSTSSKFTNAKTVALAKNSATSGAVSKLAGKKKYYVRIRTYKTVSGTKYYSAWSGAKTVTTKK